MKRATFDSTALTRLIKCCSFFMLMLSATIASAQKGKVTVVRDPLFDTLLAKRALLNRKGGSSVARFTSSYGYRLQIYNGSNRSAAYAAQARFNREFPEMRTYISYREPNFKVRAGDFRTRLEAERLKSQLGNTFTAMFIVSEKINPPKTVINND
ncbi:SPOR domain-containing protein [Mucilaginibacter terrenus]|uniref:SPOR domain-containing protein n=1 Tax=Mucilaginibacter terrenus TaxID=2482727 RepID=A0A3E2NQF3_9SPHI|nr:SPOR domain-containing protein [Mucilaginibacter terrenus]RFZ83222.1 SPOR domain-containing protein [Mucilaginibacter terrenus]